MAKSYFNSVPLDNFDLAEKIAAANNQATMIMLYIDYYFQGEFSAWDLASHFGKIPITSIRRALNLLKNKKLIVPTRLGKSGLYNDTCNFYRKASPIERQQSADHDEVSEKYAIKFIGNILLRKLINENKLNYHETENVKKFSRSEIEKAIMQEFFKVA